MGGLKMFKGKNVIVIGERDGVPGPAIAKCLEAAGANIIHTTTECFVWTAAGTMAPESQEQIKRIANDSSKDDLVVVLGASDIEGAEIAAETVTIGDPSYAGPLTGVSLKLPIYHILEPEVKASIPEKIYDQEVGIIAMIVDTEELGKKFKAIRQANIR